MLDFNVLRILIESASDDDKLDMIQSVTATLGEITAIEGSEPDKNFSLNPEQMTKIREYAATIEQMDAAMQKAKDDMSTWIMANLPKEAMTLAKLAYVRGYLRGERLRAEHEKEEKEAEEKAAAEVIDPDFRDFSTASEEVEELMRRKDAEDEEKPVS